MGNLSTVRLLEHAMVPASAKVALRLRRGEAVRRSVRMRSSDGVPFSYAVTHVPDRVARLIGSGRVVFGDRDRPVEAIGLRYRPHIDRCAVGLRRTPSDSGPV